MEQLTFDFEAARATDPLTSKLGAESVKSRRPSQMMVLLAEYVRAGLNGLTSEEAGNASGLAQNPRCCYWKRCSELLQKGLIEDTGQVRDSSAGEKQRVCRATEAGIRAVS